MQQFVWVFCPKRQDEAHKPPLGRDCGNPAFPWPAAGVPFMWYPQRHFLLRKPGGMHETGNGFQIYRMTHHASRRIRISASASEIGTYFNYIKGMSGRVI